MKQYFINNEYKKHAPTLACEIAENVVDSLDNGEYEYIEDAIDDALNTALIYTDDEWEMLKIYCTPRNCDYNNAYEDLWVDIYNLIEEVEE